MDISPPFSGFLHPQVKKVVLNLITFFKNERTGENSSGNSNVQETVSRATGISLRSVQRIIHDAKLNVTPKKKKHCKRGRPKTIDVSDTIKMEVRNVIYDLYAKNTNITLSVLSQTLKDRGILEISRQSLSTLIKNIGFRFKKDCNRRYLCEQPNILHKRVHFLRSYMENQANQLRTIIFLDETWVFSNGRASKSWQDESVKSVKRKKGYGTGKRFIILHAGSKEGFVPGASLIFSSTSKSADYHDNMNCDLFEKWLKNQLIPNLKTPALIILDNASYHSRILNKQPNQSWRKNQIYDWLQQENLNPSPNLLKTELLSMAKLHKKPEIYAVDQILHEHGHDVLRLPPYHCQFNAIELIWARAKDYYDKHIGDGPLDAKKVEHIWQNSLDQIDTEYWRKSIDHTEKLISDWWEREKILDVEVEPMIIVPSEDESEDGDSSDSSQEAAAA